MQVRQSRKDCGIAKIENLYIRWNGTIAPHGNDPAVIDLHNGFSNQLPVKWIYQRGS